MYPPPHTTDNPASVSVAGDPAQVSAPEIRGAISCDGNDPEVNARPGDPAPMLIVESVLRAVPVEFFSLWDGMALAVSCPADIFVVVSS
jgi:hypothetical protein